MTTFVPVPATGELLEELRRICAKTVDIPIDKITVEADLEADLGIDSLSMDEFFASALERYGLSAEGNRIQVTSYPTIGALADLIQQLSGEGEGGKNSGPDA
jgi:[acyl-carrier-protein] S-malonyltransferase